MRPKKCDKCGRMIGFVRAAKDGKMVAVDLQLVHYKNQPQDSWMIDPQGYYYKVNHAEERDEYGFPTHLSTCGTQRTGQGAAQGNGRGVGREARQAPADVPAVDADVPAGGVAQQNDSAWGAGDDDDIPWA